MARGRQWALHTGSQIPSGDFQPHMTRITQTSGADSQQSGFFLARHHTGSVLSLFKDVPNAWQSRNHNRLGEETKRPVCLGHFTAASSLCGFLVLAAERSIWCLHSSLRPSVCLRGSSSLTIASQSSEEENGPGRPCDLHLEALLDHSVSLCVCCRSASKQRPRMRTQQHSTAEN